MEEQEKIFTRFRLKIIFITFDGPYKSLSLLQRILYISRVTASNVRMSGPTVFVMVVLKVIAKSCDSHVDAEV